MLAGLIAKYGLSAVLIGSAIEGETVAFLGGISAHRHLLSLWTVALAAAIGSFIADQLFFFIGRKLGTSPRLQKLTSSVVADRVKALLDRHPIGFVLVFRFVYGMRTISPIVIGLTQYPPGKFVLLNGLAAFVWGWIICSAGYFFGSLIERIAGKVHLHVHLALGLLVSIAFAGLLTLWFRRKLTLRPR